MYLVIEWTDHKEISLVDFTGTNFKYQFFAGIYTTNTIFYYAKFISNTLFYYIGQTSQIDALSKTFTQQVGFI